MRGVKVGLIFSVLLVLSILSFNLTSAIVPADPNSHCNSVACGDGGSGAIVPISVGCSSGDAAVCDDAGYFWCCPKSEIIPTPGLCGSGQTAKCSGFYSVPHTYQTCQGNVDCSDSGLINPIQSFFALITGFTLQKPRLGDCDPNGPPRLCTNTECDAGIPDCYWQTITTTLSKDCSTLSESGCDANPECTKTCVVDPIIECSTATDCGFCQLCASPDAGTNWFCFDSVFDPKNECEEYTECTSETTWRSHSGSCYAGQCYVSPSYNCPTGRVCVESGSVATCFIPPTISLTYPSNNQQISGMWDKYTATVTDDKDSSITCTSTVKTSTGTILSHPQSTTFSNAITKTPSLDSDIEPTRTNLIFTLTCTDSDGARSSITRTGINVTAGCSETDDGADYDKKGTTTNTTVSQTDYCINQGTLREYYCSAGRVVYTDVVCSNIGFTGCSLGACFKDTTPPTITITAPSSSISAFQNITFRAIDASGINSSSCRYSWTAIEAGPTGSQYSPTSSSISSVSNNTLKTVVVNSEPITFTNDMYLGINVSCRDMAGNLGWKTHSSYVSSVAGSCNDCTHTPCISGYSCESTLDSKKVCVPTGSCATGSGGASCSSTTTYCVSSTTYTCDTSTGNWDAGQKIIGSCGYSENPNFEAFWSPDGEQMITSMEAGKPVARYFVDWNGYFSGSVSFTGTGGWHVRTMNSGGVVTAPASSPGTLGAGTYTFNGSTSAGSDVATLTVNPDSARCGDGTIQTSNDETCDNGDSLNGVVCTAGYNSPCTYCSSTCQTVTVPADGVSGDGICDSPHETCSHPDCIGKPQCISCGNGIVEGTEQCDNGEANTNTCSATYGQTVNYCSLTCTSESCSGGNCSDDILNGGEIQVDCGDPSCPPERRSCPEEEETIQFCEQYTNQTACEAYNQSVADESVGGPYNPVNQKAKCIWVDGDVCKGALENIAPDGMKIGLCIFTQNPVTDTCEDGFLSYSWNATPEWDVNNEYRPNPSPPYCNEGYVLSDGFCRRNPSDFLDSCKPGQRTIPCPAKIQLNYFTWKNLVAAVLLVIIVYLLLNNKKKKEEKKVTETKVSPTKKKSTKKPAVKKSVTKKTSTKKKAVTKKRK